MNLADKTCVPPAPGTPPLTNDEANRLLRQLDGWEIDKSGHLTKTYRLADFKEALALVDRIGALAEAQDHHPDICFGWGVVRVDIWTHKVGGLTESDFVFAAKCDALS